MKIISAPVVNKVNQNCKGYKIQTPSGTEYECGYDTKISCDQCRYVTDREDKRTGKLPSAKINSN